MAFTRVDNSPTTNQTLLDGMEIINDNYTLLEGTGGADEIGIAEGTFSATTVQEALVELNTYDTTHTGDTDLHISATEREDIDRLYLSWQEQYNAVYSNIEVIPEILESKSTEYSTIFRAIALPESSGMFRIVTESPCFIAFGDSGVEASVGGSNSIPIYSGIEYIGTDTGTNTHMAIIAVDTAGTANISGLDRTYKMQQLVTYTRSYDDVSKSVLVYSLDRKVKLYLPTDAYMTMATSSPITVTSANGILLTAGMYVLELPTASAHVSIVQKNTAGTAIIMGYTT